MVSCKTTPGLSEARASNVANYSMNCCKKVIFREFGRRSFCLSRIVKA